MCFKPSNDKNCIENFKNCFENMKKLSCSLKCFMSSPEPPLNRNELCQLSYFVTRDRPNGATNTASQLRLNQKVFLKKEKCSHKTIC